MQVLLANPVFDAAQAAPVLTSEERSTIALFQKSTPSVVYILNLAKTWVLCCVVF